MFAKMHIGKHVTKPLGIPSIFQMFPNGFIWWLVLYGKGQPLKHGSNCHHVIYKQA